MSIPSIPSSGNRYSTMTYSSREEIIPEGTERTLTIFKDFFISRDVERERRYYRSVLHNSISQKDLRVDEDVVIISIFNGLWGYFHLLFNILGEIEFIRHFYPNVKIKIIKYIDPNNYFVNKLKNLGIFEAYNITDEDIIDISDCKTIYFKNVFSIFSEYNHTLRYIYHSAFDYDTENNKMLDWGNIIAKRFRSSFKVENNISPNRKIFISRLKDNDKLRQESEIIYKKVLGYPLSITEISQIIKIKDSQLSEAADRPMAKIDEVLLEKLFSDAGYEIVDPGKLVTIYEQAELYASASHIVGLSGAGFVNCCFTHPQSKILILNSSNSYSFPHKHIVESYGRQAAEAPNRNPLSKKINFAQGIFKYVKENHPDFFD